jgi:hypothetical protein
MKRSKLLLSAVLDTCHEGLKANLPLSQWRRIDTENGRLAANGDGKTTHNRQTAGNGQTAVSPPPNSQARTKVKRPCSPKQAPNSQERTKAKRPCPSKRAPNRQEQKTAVSPTTQQPGMNLFSDDLAFFAALREFWGQRRVPNHNK